MLDNLSGPGVEKKTSAHGGLLKRCNFYPKAA
jgi:hypothetical protein